MILSVRGGALWKTDIDSGDEALLARIGRGAWNLSVSPGGDKAAYLQNGDLWLVDLANGEVTQATNVGIPSLSSLPAGRYSRPEREIGPGI